MVTGLTKAWVGGYPDGIISLGGGDADTLNGMTYDQIINNLRPSSKDMTFSFPAGDYNTKTVTCTATYTGPLSPTGMTLVSTKIETNSTHFGTLNLSGVVPYNTETVIFTYTIRESSGVRWYLRMLWFLSPDNSEITVILTSYTNSSSYEEYGFYSALVQGTIS